MIVIAALMFAISWRVSAQDHPATMATGDKATCTDTATPSQAVCPSGLVVIGGGWELSSARHAQVNANPITSKPLDDGKHPAHMIGWSVTTVKQSGPKTCWTAYVVCVPSKPTAK